ncbi:helix-turn-helix domain-containing protein [Tropicimonas marinistellae]|uniref:helix-turn-helix domain-containing protein n=1 Tax=Tropicimonas marinistellae TaxID=1739787 RepID=UPI00082CD0D4|nr:helix-turn-helix transcriptional regulator [Tropicimonas marinistellae]
MLFKGQDWARLCRDYRERHGLKQEAMAQDFNVDQSSVSRWERGLREPSLRVKQAILNDMVDAGEAEPDLSVQLLLEHSGSAVAIWDRRGVLRGCSPRFARELAHVLGHSDARASLVGRHATDLLQGNEIVDRCLRVLDEREFFTGSVLAAVFSFPPFLQPRRQDKGGLITASTFPIQLSNGELAMLSVLDHDVFGEAPERPDALMVSWVNRRDGHSETAWEEV